MVNCPVCEGKIDVDADEVDEGDTISCDECGADLKVLGTDPLELESVDDLDEDDEGEEEDEEGFLEDEDTEEDPWSRPDDYAQWVMVEFAEAIRGVSGLVDQLLEADDARIGRKHVSQILAK